MTTAVLEHPAIVGFVEHTIDAEAVRRRRALLGWSQDELAERAGMTGRTVSNAEHGKVGEATAARILAALDQGERERRKASEPDMVTVTQTIDTSRGQISVTAVVRRDQVGRVDLMAAVRRILEDDQG